MPKGRKPRQSVRNKAEKPYSKASQNEPEASGQNDAVEENQDGEPATCAVCDEIITEPTDDEPGDEAVYCEGKCESWFHRKCVGLSRTAYTLASEPESPPFYCLLCMQLVYLNEINKLKEHISSLSSQVALLSGPQHQGSSQSTNKVTRASPAQVTQQVPASAPVINKSSQPLQQSTKKSTNATSTAHDRKYNIILYGLQECPKGTNRSLRTKKELEKVTEVLSKIEKDVGPQSIRDCFRLGKYKEIHDRPRPVLIKMNRSIDVISLLSACKNLPDCLAIKPDLTPEERQLDSILLKERWGLIQSGQNKKDIKIQGTKLYLKGNLYGNVIDFNFVLYSNGELPGSATEQNTDTTGSTSNSASSTVPAVVSPMDTATSTFSS